MESIIFFVILGALTAILVPLFILSCRRSKVVDFVPIVVRAVIWYVVTALVVAGALLLIDARTESLYHLLLAWVTIAGYWGGMFAVLYVPLILLLAYLMSRKPKRPAS